VLRQTLENTCGRVVLPQQGGWREHLADRRFDLCLEALHAERTDLADDDVAVTVEHEPRQPVRFAENPAVVGRRRQPVAQLQSLSQTGRKPGTSDRRLALARQDTSGDQRRGIEVGNPQGLAAVADDTHLRTRLEAGKRRRRRVDFIAEDPQVPGAQAPVFAPAQSQLGEARNLWRNQGCRPGGKSAAQSSGS
jgi:hypothetical protein